MVDRDEFLLLFLRHEPEIRAFVGSLLLDRDVREDVFQECALVMWQRFDTYDDGRPFGAWARGIAANKILQRRDADRRFPIAFSPEAIQAVLGAYERTEELSSIHSATLEDCVDQLPAHSRELISLRYADNLKAPEIAERTQRTLDAVYQALSRI